MQIDKNGEEIRKNISYILQLIDSTIVMASSLTNLVTNLSGGLYRIKCKSGHHNKNVKHVKLNISIVAVFVNTQILKMIK